MGQGKVGFYGLCVDGIIPGDVVNSAPIGVPLIGLSEGLGHVFQIVFQSAAGALGTGNGKAGAVLHGHLPRLLLISGNGGVLVHPIVAEADDHLLRVFHTHGEISRLCQKPAGTGAQSGIVVFHVCRVQVALFRVAGVVCPEMIHVKIAEFGYGAIRLQRDRCGQARASIVSIRCKARHLQATDYLHRPVAKGLDGHIGNGCVNDDGIFQEILARLQADRHGLICPRLAERCHFLQCKHQFLGVLYTIVCNGEGFRKHTLLSIPHVLGIWFNDSIFRYS